MDRDSVGTTITPRLLGISNVAAAFAFVFNYK